jgi:protein gp37
MCDVMEDRSDLEAERTKLYDVIEQTPYLDWLLLTKRPQNFRRFLPSDWMKEPLKNVWLMTTVESEDFLWRIDELMKAPAVVYGVSAEPLLGPITLPKVFLELGKNAWVITGGESGRKARTKDNVDLYLDLMRQCRKAGVPFFFKQHGVYVGGTKLVNIMRTKTFNSRSEATAERERLNHTLNGRVHENFPVIRYRYEFGEWRDVALDVCASAGSAA